MSKLSKALIEVIFEIKWTVQGKKEIQEVQYLHGDLYPLLKSKYPFRESVNPNVPIDLLLMHAPSHRFRTAASDYPLVQVGPGLVTVNTVDSKYYWEEYEASIMEVIGHLQSVYSLKHHHDVHLVLQYIDLLKFDFQKGDIVKFMEENLNISIKQGFYKGNSTANNALLILNYPMELGSLNINVGRGKDNKGFDGVTISTNIVSGNIKPEIALIRKWLNDSHEVCSTLFKDMTRGKLYESFK